ncbi:MAG: YaiI/YqxD family protein [Syntrophomonadaceae bacterium]|nr:YaiI/YqxD family protein [Syntrophomonadaceae bacterium]MDD3022970.1 YaiI/YqxD family protein [Syntrophomonadaceae bacterium]
MKILVDADACPVKDIIEEVAEKYQLEVIMLCNPNHVLQSSYSQIMVVDGSSQAVDIAIVNRTAKGDLVVTQDYGLASLVLGKNALAIHPSGKVYNQQNIDGLLTQRFLNQKARQAGIRTINPKKRKNSDDEYFRLSFTQLLSEHISR